MPEPTPPTKTPEVLAREAEIKRVQEIMERSLSTQKAEELADHHMEVGKATTSLFAFLFLFLSLPPPSPFFGCDSFSRNTTCKL